MYLLTMGKKMSLKSFVKTRKVTFEIKTINGYT